MKRWLALFLCSTLMTGGFGGCGKPPKTVDGATLVTFGDSITALSTWPKDVAARLNMHLVNAGIGGHTSAHGWQRFERDVASASPDFVIISFGSNDFYRPDGGNPRVAVDEYAANLTAMIDQTKALGAVPLLMTPPFIAPDAAGGPSFYPERDVNQALDHYVNAMREVAQKQHVDLIDIHMMCDDGQSVDTFLCADGVHLSPLGNQRYQQTIVEYFTAHFTRDLSVPKVPVPTAPPLQSGAWTQDVVSFDTADWREVFPDTVRAECIDGDIVLTALQDGWPEIHYSPAITDAVTVKAADTVLNVDVDLVAAANLTLFFNGITPTLAYSGEHISLTEVLKKADPAIRVTGADLCGGQRIQATVPLKDFVPPSFIASDGTVILSGLKVFVIGAAGSTVTIHQFSVTAQP